MEEQLKRGEAYNELKQKISDGLLNLFEKRFPGFKNLVDYQELSTPLSIEHFTNRAKGAMYGVPAIPNRWKMKWLKVTTPIENLYLTGSDVVTSGIMGSLMGGGLTARILNGGRDLMKIIEKMEAET